MAKQAKMKKGSIGKKALAAILAASMVLSSSAFSVLAAPAIIGADEPAPAATTAYQGELTIKYNKSNAFKGVSNTYDGTVEADNKLKFTNTLVYDGTSKKPDAIEIEQTGNPEKKLIEGEDYDLTYGVDGVDNVNAGKDAGFVDITFKQNLEGDFNYEGQKSRHLTFDIDGITLNQSTAEIELEEPNNVEYTGTKAELNVTVKTKGSGAKTLVRGTDYELCDQNGKDLELIEYGSYNLYVKGLGNYCGNVDAASVTADALGSSPKKFTINQSILTNDKVDIECNKVLINSTAISKTTAEKAIKVTDKYTHKELAIDTNYYEYLWENPATGEYEAYDNAFESTGGISMPGTYNFKIVPDGYDEKTGVAVAGAEGNFNAGVATGSLQVTTNMDLQELVDNYGKDDANREVNLLVKKVDGAYELKDNGTYTGANLWTNVKKTLDTVVAKASFAGEANICKVSDEEITMVDADEYEITLAGLVGHSGETAKIKVRIKPASINTDAEASTAGTGNGNVNTGLQSGYTMSITEGTTVQNNLTKPVIKITHKNKPGLNTTAADYDLEYEKDYKYTTKTVKGQTVVMIEGIGNYTTKTDDSSTFDVTITGQDRKAGVPLDSEIIRIVVNNVKYSENKVVTDANLEVWDVELGKKLEKGVDYVINGQATVEDGKLVITIAEPANPTHYIGEREIEIGIDGENEFSNVVYLEDIGDYTMDKDSTAITVTDVNNDIDKKLKYIKGNGFYDNGTTKKTSRKITDADGKVYSTDNLDPGKDYTVEVREKEGRYNGSLTDTFHVYGPDISGHVTLSAIKDQAYTGAEIRPDVTVTWDGEIGKLGTTDKVTAPGVSTDADKVLKKDVDYKVEYFNNVNAGIAKAVVTFTKKYSGSVERYFNITGVTGALVFADPNQKSLLENGVKVGSDDVTLNIVPSAADDTLKLSYASDNTDVVTVDANGKLSFKGEGTATITVTATSSKASYAPLKVTVKVAEDGDEPSVSIKTPTITLSRNISKKAKTFTVSTCKVAGATKWQVQYSLKKARKANGDLKANKTKTYASNKAGRLYRKVITCNKSGKKYYVRVRAYVNGDWSAWSDSEEGLESIKSR